MKASQELFPTFEQGDVNPPAKIFEDYELTLDELETLREVTHMIFDAYDNQGATTIVIGRDNISEAAPWLAEWSEHIDTWIEQNGLLLPLPLHPSNEGIIASANGSWESAPHQDAWINYPIGTSTSVQGARGLAGVILPGIEEAYEHAARIRDESIDLFELSEYEGLPVEHAYQGPGHTTLIANYATVHTGRPLEMCHVSTRQEIPSIVTILGYNAVLDESGYQYAMDLQERFFGQAVTLQGDDIEGLASSWT